MAKSSLLEKLMSQSGVIDGNEVQRVLIWKKEQTLRIYFKDGEVIDAKII